MRRKDSNTQIQIDLFKKLVDKLPYGVIIWNLEIPNDPGSFRLEYFNAIAPAVSSTPMKELLGKNVRESFPEFLEAGIPELYLQCLKSEQSTVIGEFEYSDKYVRDRIYKIEAIPLTKTHIGVIFNDITNKRKVERQLQQSEERFRRIFAHAPFGAALVDLDGYPVMNNKTLQDMLGYTEEEIKNMTFTEFTHPDDVEKSLEYYNDLTSGKINFYSFEKRYVHKNGNLVWGSIAVTATRAQEDQLENIIWMVQDITERKLMEEALINEKEKIRSNIDNLNDGVVLIDMDGSIYIANNNFRKYYKRFSNLEAPLTIEEFHKEGNIFGETIYQLFLTKNQETTTIEPREGLYLQLTSKIIFDTKKQPINVSILVRNISSFIKFDNLRKKFISTASHELRTPLTSIILTINNLMKYEKKINPERKEKLLKTIARNSSLLNDIIDDLLVISRIDAKKIKINWEKYYLVALIKDIHLQLSPKLKEKNTRLIIEGQLDTWVLGDSKRIEQILRILIDNAIKYSYINSEIRTIIIDNYQGQYNPRTQEGILIQVMDNGIGISRNDQSRLFERFFRSDDVLDISGTGLGLSIAKEIVHLHNGEIFVESEKAKGSTFNVFLPRFKSPLL